MYRKKSKLALQNHPFTLINNEINNIVDAVDAMVKELISPRSWFCINSMKIEFFNSEPYVTLDCTYAEQE